MTLEQKAKAYDEALKAAIAAHKDEDRHLKATLERIFPELQESEDERIRKGLIKALGTIGKRNWGGIDVFESIAWLEKVKDFDKQLEDAYKTADEVQYKRGYDDGYLEGIANAKKEFEKQGKQEWTEEDESMCKGLISYFNYNPLKYSEESVCNWLKSIKERLQ